MNRRGDERVAMSRCARFVGLTLGVLAAPVLVWAFGLVIVAAFLPLPAELRQTGDAASSVRILDRSGALVREVRGDDGCKARWVSLDDLGDVAARAMVAAEDRRFYWHP